MVGACVLSRVGEGRRLAEPACEGRFYLIFKGSGSAFRSKRTNVEGRVASHGATSLHHGQAGVRVSDPTQGPGREGARGPKC